MKPAEAAFRAGRPRTAFRLMLAIAAVTLLAACSHTEGTSGASTAGPYSGGNKYAPGAGQSAKGFTLFGGHSTKSVASAAQGVGVNGYLWRASLDTLSFMPLASADPFGGTIITDWYSPSKTPDERFKVTVYILDTQLRADGLKVSVFRQTKDAQGGWVDASVDPQTDSKMENAILTRARQLHLNSMNSK
jgi:uncharacterized lipoprotein